MPLTIFISHIAQEAELANAVKAVIDEIFAERVSVYASSDGESVSAGDRWLEGIAASLKSSQLHLVLCSRASLKRPWVNFETGAAWIRNTPIVPVCHSGFTPNDLPMPLNIFQSVQLCTSDGFKRIVDKIVSLTGAKLPKIDLSLHVESLKMIESRLVAAAKAASLIVNPAVLCATYHGSDNNFDADCEIISAVFDNVTVMTDLTSVKLVQTLGMKRFDILHLFVAIEPATGNIIFPGSSQTITPPAFRTLVQRCGAKLVVLATCRGTLLAIQVAPVSNIVFCDFDILDTEVNAWMEIFYPLLKAGMDTVETAHELATQGSQIPMYICRGPDVAFA